jgi:uncharacterized tellurite resistance protein B-like protein
MLNLIKNLLGCPRDPAEVAREERQQLKQSVAQLLHECMRVDVPGEHPVETAAAHNALTDLFACDAAEAAALLAQARANTNSLSSYFAATSAIKRAFSPEERARLVEHLWRITYADGNPDLEEEHLVRKIADLIYVSNTHSMMARSRARGTHVVVK